MNVNPKSIVSNAILIHATCIKQRKLRPSAARGAILPPLDELDKFADRDKRPVCKVYKLRVCARVTRAKKKLTKQKRERERERNRRL